MTLLLTQIMAPCLMGNNTQQPMPDNFPYCIGLISTDGDKATAPHFGVGTFRIGGRNSYRHHTSDSCKYHDHAHTCHPWSDGIRNAQWWDCTWFDIRGTAFTIAMHGSVLYGLAPSKRWVTILGWVNKSTRNIRRVCTTQVHEPKIATYLKIFSLLDYF